MPFSETRSTGKIEVEGEDMSCYTHQTLFQQQLYNLDLKPLLYMPALSETFHTDVCLLLSLTLFVQYKQLSDSTFKCATSESEHSSNP